MPRYASPSYMVTFCVSDIVHGVAVLELLVLLLILEQRRQVVGNDRSVCRLFAAPRAANRPCRSSACRLRTPPRPPRWHTARVVREVRVRIIQLQRLLKALLQPLEEVQRAAEKQHIALDLAALCQTRDGLVDDGLEDGRGDVLLARALVEQRLNVRLGEYAAAGRDGVDASPRPVRAHPARTA